MTYSICEMPIFLLTVLLSLLPVALLNAEEAKPEIKIGSKSFTESVIIGEMIATIAQAEGYETRHKAELGGTGLVWDALLAGDVDVYPDYTGTVAEMILQDPGLTEMEAIRVALAEYGVKVTPSMGFENTYAIGMVRERAERLGIRKVSELSGHPKLKFGFGNEFMDREDGWPGLRKAYGLTQSNVRGLDHMLAYRALKSGDIDAMDVYTTDANIRQYDIRVLEDDRDYFPNYSAVLLYRADLEQRAPGFVKAISRLATSITVEDMRAMNEQVDVDGEDESQAAAQFIRAKFASDKELVSQIQVKSESLFARIWSHTWQHLYLVVISLVAAIVVAIPLGIAAAKISALQQVILTAAEIIQTIPGLALLILVMTPVRMLGFSVVGAAPAIVALFLYSLLPIIRNTFTGIQDIPKSTRESALALGLTPWARLWNIELPLASRTILAGIKTTAVINVGYATLGGLIGAGGYGELIMRGLRRSSEAKMLEGAIPAALLALVVKVLFELIERRVVPKGLRL